MTPIISGVHRLEKEIHRFWPNDKQHHNFVPYAVQVFIFEKIFCKMAKICEKKSSHYIVPHEDTLRKEEKFQVARKEV